MPFDVLPQEDKPETMTAQEFFDATVRHLFAQGAPSYDREADLCRYRMADGRRCAVGLHIRDSEYNHTMEGCVVADFIFSEALPKEHVVIRHAEIAKALQSAHDAAAFTVEPDNSNWAACLHDELTNAARKCGLRYV